MSRLRSIPRTVGILLICAMFAVSLFLAWAIVFWQVGSSVISH